jgi:hypothetical protein
MADDERILTRRWIEGHRRERMGFRSEHTCPHSESSHDVAGKDIHRCIPQHTHTLSIERHEAATVADVAKGGWNFETANEPHPTLALLLVVEVWK